MTETTDHCARPDCPGYGWASFDRFGFCTEGMHERESAEAPAAEPGEFEFIDPVPPERSRRCPNNHFVGRTGDGRPGPLRGVCDKCGADFDFTPTLAPGDVLDGRYEVAGCVARGGVGGIYVAFDRHLEDHVILKGLINPSSEEARALVEAERRYLVTVKHPRVVDIHNSVKHPFGGGSELEYLVMEYIPGRPLSDPDHPSRTGPEGQIPPQHAVAFMLEVLDAFAYLHEFGLVYCDLKPGNIIQHRGRLTLIDLGAMRRIEGDQSPVYGTIGYQAPEIVAGGPPDAVSDLYTVGRTLAVLTLPFDSAEQVGGEVYSNPLPDRPDRYNESLHLFVRRAAAPERSVRFASAADMADQLRGVLRQVQAERGLEPTPAASTRFGPERGAFASALADSSRRVFALARPGEARSMLPTPLVDPDDSAFPALETLAMQTAGRARGLVEELEATPEVLLARLRLAIELQTPDVPGLFKLAEAEFGPHWRLDWYRGVHALGRDTAKAAEHFWAVRRHLPGELAPMLALAICEELVGGGEHSRRAALLYRQVWQTDRNHTSAAFGVARQSAVAAERIGALEAVPTSSSNYLAAQQALVAERVRRDPDAAGVVEAGANLDNLGDLDGSQADLIEAELWRAALTVVDAAGDDPAAEVRGVPLTRDAIGLEYETVLKRISSNCSSPLPRWALVQEANRNRPRTWL